ncbi:hypothetical protein JCM6882_005332 [Rhodosporidiobolus microsporus]
MFPPRWRFVSSSSFLPVLPFSSTVLRRHAPSPPARPHPLIADEFDDPSSWRNLPPEERDLKLDERDRVGMALALASRKLHEVGMRMVWRTARTTSRDCGALAAVLSSSPSARHLVEELVLGIVGAADEPGVFRRLQQRLFRQTDPITSLLLALPSLPHLKHLSLTAATTQPRISRAALTLSLPRRLPLSHLTLSFHCPLSYHEPFYLRTFFSSTEPTALKYLSLTVEQDGFTMLDFLLKCKNLAVLLLALDGKAWLAVLFALPGLLSFSLTKLQYLSLGPYVPGHLLSPLPSDDSLMLSLPCSLVAAHLFLPLQSNKAVLGQLLRGTKDDSALRLLSWGKRPARRGGKAECVAAAKVCGVEDGEKVWVQRDGEGLFEGMLRESGLL